MKLYGYCASFLNVLDMIFLAIKGLLPLYANMSFFHSFTIVFDRV